MSVITDIGLLALAETPWVLVGMGKLSTPGRSRQQGGKSSTGAGTDAALQVPVVAPRQPAPPLMATGQPALRRKRRPGEPARNAPLSAYAASRPREHGRFLPVDSQPAANGEAAG